MVLKELKIFFDNGNLECQAFIDERDRFQGIYRYFDEDGTLSNIRNHVDDLRHGEVIHYRSDGSISLHSIYVYDEYIGNISEFSEMDKFELCLKYGFEITK